MSSTTTDARICDRGQPLRKDRNAAEGLEPTHRVQVVGSLLFGKDIAHYL
jgi:hypothetical protein